MMYSHRFQDFDSGKHKAGSSVKANLAMYHRRFSDKSPIGISMKAILKYSSGLFFWQDENSTRTLFSRRIKLKRGENNQGRGTLCLPSSHSGSSKRNSIDHLIPNFDRIFQRHTVDIEQGFCCFRSIFIKS